MTTDFRRLIFMVKRSSLKKRVEFKFCSTAKLPFEV